MSEFVPVVAERVTDAALRIVLGESGETVDTIGDFARQVMSSVQHRAIDAAIAHPDFQRQLRAYVAEQMRGLVPDEMTMAAAYFRDIHPRERLGRNTCRAETLANIAKWESSNGQ